jgi:transglutaminase-like putative cysteine protease
MIRLDLHFELDYRIDSPHGDFVFNIQPAHTAAQHVLQESVVLTPEVPWRSETVASTRNRLLRLRAPQGDLHLTYTASVTIEHGISEPAFIDECPIDQLPVELLSYLAPSRYCESDRLIPWAEAEFGHLPSGYARAAAIAAWVQRHIAYSSYGSTTQTTALDTLTDRVGVCRDQAHVMIALCRALSLPARYVTGTDYGADPTKAPDFHAYVEVYLGRRWYTFDASGTGIPMGLRAHRHRTRRGGRAVRHLVRPGPGAVRAAGARERVRRAGAAAARSREQRLVHRWRFSGVSSRARRRMIAFGRPPFPRGFHASFAAPTDARKLDRTACGVLPVQP